MAGLGVLYFALFPILFNASLIFTTAARGSLALSTLPLLTMLVGAALGSEALTARKTAGVSSRWAAWRWRCCRGFPPHLPAPGAAIS